MANHEGTRWRGQIPIPDHCHPLVKRYLEILNEEDTTLKEAAKAAGLSPGTMTGWRYRATPTILNFEAALNAMDYELKIVKRKAPLQKPKQIEPVITGL